MKKQYIKLFEEFESEESTGRFADVDVNDLVTGFDDYLRLGYEEDMVQSLLDEIEQGSWESDIQGGIQEIADSNVSIYNADLWKLYGDNPRLADYIDEAASEGLLDISSFNIIKALQIGQYEYNYQLLNYVVSELGLED